MSDGWIEVEDRMGDALVSGGRKITPFSQVIRLRIPYLPGGLTWNRPASILVTEEDGQEQVLPITDVTRLAQVAVLAAGFVMPLILWWVSRRRR